MVASENRVRDEEQAQTPAPLADIDRSVDSGGFLLAGQPVLVLARDGAILACNSLAAETARIFAETAIRPALAAMVGRAMDGNSLVSEPLEVPPGYTTQMLELILMPQPGGHSVICLVCDRTLDFSLRLALIESRGRYKDLVELSKDFVWETSADGSFVFVPPEGAFGYSARELVGHRASSFLFEGMNTNDRLPFETPSPLDDMEIWIRRADGQPACVMASAVPLTDSRGEWKGARGICRDITERHERDRAFARVLNRERMFAKIIRTFRSEVDPEKMLEVAAVTSAQGLGASSCQIFTMINAAPGVQGPVMKMAANAGDHPGEKLLSQVLSQLVPGEEVSEVVLHSWSVLCANTWYQDRRNGAVFLWRRADRPGWEEDDRLLVANLAAQVGIAVEQIVNHQRLLEISRTDPLTGLFNRRAFYEEVKRRFGRMQRSRGRAALIYADLDNFKAVNDVHGHARGDEALIAMRDILYNNTRSIDLVARLGGDEFAVWLENADQETASRRAEVFLASGKVLDEFSGSRRAPLYMSLGVAVYDPRFPEDLSSFIARADAAMYSVKRRGKGDWALADAPQGGGQ